MLSDEELIYEQYVFSKRMHHNLISENKCCLNCGILLTEEEMKSTATDSLDDDDDFDNMPKCNINGVVIYEGENQHGRYACIATGIKQTSTNVKTGPMIQIFMVNRDVHPVEAIKSGANQSVCFSCKHRPATDEERAKGIKGGSCYVDVAKSVSQVYKAYKNGRYESIIGTNQYEEIFKGRKVRFGAYGEPVLIPIDLVERIVKVASGHTGYTHTWKDPKYKSYQRFFMASADSEGEYGLATAMGWRTFRVSTEWDMKPNEMICLNSWQNKTCFDCLQCNGVEKGNKRNIIIKVHGKLKGNFKGGNFQERGESSTAITNFGEDGDATAPFDKSEVDELSKSQQLQIKMVNEIEEAERVMKEKRRQEKKDLVKRMERMGGHRIGEYNVPPRSKERKQKVKGIVKGLKENE